MMASRAMHLSSDMPEIWAIPEAICMKLAYGKIVSVESGNDIMFAINIPQESVTIPETMDAVRAATGMQQTREDGTAATNKYLNCQCR